jgi:polyhydroxyalkanoate synthesis regulator phasin
MPTNPLQDLIDAGLQFTEVPRKQAEKVVRDLVKRGEVNRAEATKTIEGLVERGRETSAMIAQAIKSEVSRQFGLLADRVAEIEVQLEGLLGRFSGGAAVTLPTMDGGSKEAARTSPPARKKSTAARKAPAKKATAKSTAKKSTARKKSAAKKAPAKKAAAKKAGASS